MNTDIEFADDVMPNDQLAQILTRIDQSEIRLGGGLILVMVLLLAMLGFMAWAILMHSL